MSENNLLIELEKLLNFGEVNLLKIDISKHDFKLNTIYALIGVIHYHSEAILILSKNGKLFSSEIILRSLFEGFVNLKYILLVNDEKNAIKFTIKNFTDNKEFTKKWKEFIKKTNKHINFFPELSTAEKCDEFMEKMEREISNIEEKFGVLKRFPNCRALSEEIDKIDENHTFELMYITIYEYLSGLVHISSKGLKNFFIYNENGYTFNFSRNEPKEIKKVLVAVYEIYLNTLEILNQNFKISNKNELETFKNFFLEIGKKSS